MLSLGSSASTFYRTVAKEMLAHTQPFIPPARDAVETFPWEGLYISTDH
ncbi:hypothetical protein [Brevibacterium sp. FME17]|nr:hypothetical protein [Brevibacterium sp. FME17]